jgi:hypothetical protein
MIEGEGLQGCVQYNLRLGLGERFPEGLDAKVLAEIARFYVELPQLFGQRLEAIDDNMNHG